MSLIGRMSYGDYLRIDQILGAQNTLTTAHDEMLFIIQHQTSGLWMRLALHELNAARAANAADKTPQAFKMPSRTARLFEQRNSAWNVLRTMTPSNDTHFRDDLGQSSGFQSAHYRLIEYAPCNRNPAQHWQAYQLAEKLMDIKDHFRSWRFNHVTTVERIIGFKRGTGGTSGVAYLRRMLDIQLFPELWCLRTAL